MTSDQITQDTMAEFFHSAGASVDKVPYKITKPPQGSQYGETVVIDIPKKKRRLNTIEAGTTIADHFNMPIIGMMETWSKKNHKQNKQQMVILKSTEHTHEFLSSRKYVNNASNTAFKERLDPFRHPSVVVYNFMSDNSRSNDEIKAAVTTVCGNTKDFITTFANARRYIIIARPVPSGENAPALAVVVLLEVAVNNPGVWVDRFRETIKHIQKLNGVIRSVEDYTQHHVMVPFPVLSYDMGYSYKDVFYKIEDESMIPDWRMAAETKRLVSLNGVSPDEQEQQEADDVPASSSGSYSIPVIDQLKHPCPRTPLYAQYMAISRVNTIRLARGLHQTDQMFFTATDKPWEHRVSVAPPDCCSCGGFLYYVYDETNAKITTRCTRGCQSSTVDSVHKSSMNPYDSFIVCGKKIPEYHVQAITRDLNECGLVMTERCSGTSVETGVLVYKWAGYNSFSRDQDANVGTHWEKITDKQEFKNHVIIPMLERRYSLVTQRYSTGVDTEKFDKGKEAVVKASTLDTITMQVLQNNACAQSTRERLTQLDADPSKIGVRGGKFIDLVTGIEQRLRPSVLITKYADFDYIPPTDKNYQLYRQVILEIMGGDEEMLDYIQRLLGYSITGFVTDRCGYIHIGDGKNGKSLLFKSFLNALYLYAISTDRKLLCVTSNETANTASPALARLKGMRAVVANEINKDDVINSAMLKTLTDGSFIQARNLYGTIQSFKAIGKLHLVCNDLPNIDTNDPAVVDRLVVVRYPTRFGATVDKDNNLVALEHAGLANWIETSKDARDAAGSFFVDGAKAALREIMERSNGIDATSVLEHGSLKEFKENEIRVHSGDVKKLTGNLRIPEQVIQSTNDAIERVDMTGSFVKQRLDVSPPPDKPLGVDGNGKLDCIGMYKAYAFDLQEQFDAFSKLSCLKKSKRDQDTVVDALMKFFNRKGMSWIKDDIQSGVRCIIGIRIKPRFTDNSFSV